MNLYEAVYVRKSVRKYRMEPLDEALLVNLNSFIKRLTPLIPEIAVDFLIVDNCKGDAKVTSLFKVEAPYYLMISSELKQDYLLNAGFLMQQIVLYLTARNIGTCYQGGLKPDVLLRAEMKYDYVIAIAFGRGGQEVYRDPKRARRLLEKDLVVFKEEPLEVMHTLLKAARIAPSSLNNQPWRFVVYQNRIHVFCKKGRLSRTVLSDGKLIDIGIMLCNMMQAAEEMWVTIVISDLDQIKERQFKNVEYITSVILQDE